MDAKFCTGAVVGAAAAAAFCLWRSRSQGVPPRGSPESKGLPVASAGVLAGGRVAVITGAGTGIGRACAKRCASLGMKVVLAGNIKEDLGHVQEECVNAGAPKANVAIHVCNVAEESDVRKLKDFAFKTYGAVHFLMNNAAIQNNGKAGPYEHLDRWRDVMAVNLWGVVHGCQVFAPAMIEQNEPAVIVNTGSKQGITAPPGDTAYNVSKAGVKVLTEALQHSLRSTPGCKVNAFLLVPGWTITMITTLANKRMQGREWDPEKAQDERSYDGTKDAEVARQRLQARGAWTADQVVDELFGAVNAGAPFYVICPDNETTRAMDNGRMQWSADDLLFRRLPLSRWSEQHKAEYAEVSKHF